MMSRSREFSFRKLSVTIILGGLLSLTAYTSFDVAAQDASSQAEDIFELSLDPRTQSIWDKSVVLDLRLKASVDSSKAQVRWQLPRQLEVTGGDDVWFSLQENEPVSFELKVKPEQAGSYKILVEVEAWRYDANYVDSVTLELEFDENLELVPQTPEYQQNKVVWFWARVGGLIVALTLLFLLLILSLRWFKRWLAAD